MLTGGGQPTRDWASNPAAVSDGSIESAHAYAALLYGDTAHVATYVDAVKQLKFPTQTDPGFAWPFTVADAGWLLQVVTHQPN